jgi:threonine/homoserine/homoserine lactone efflux protein
MISDILLGIPWGLFLSFMIGPVFFILIETSITKGFKGALVFDFGVIVADMVFIAIAYLGSYRLIQNLKDKPSLFIFGGMVMLVYGFISFLNLKKIKGIKYKFEKKDMTKKNYFKLFLKGFFLNIINIGVLGFWLAIIISVGPKLDLQPFRMLTFFTTVIISYLIVDCVKMLLAKQLKSKLTPLNILKIKKGICVVLMIFGLILISQGFFPEEKEMVKKTINKIHTF